MNAFLVIAGVILFLYAVPSSRPTTNITFNKMTHVHVHVEVKMMTPPAPLEGQEKALPTLMETSIPAGTALERYRTPQFQVTERKILA